jgi:hypothetical protein
VLPRAQRRAQRRAHRRALERARGQRRRRPAALATALVSTALASTALASTTLAGTTLTGTTLTGTALASPATPAHAAPGPAAAGPATGRPPWAELRQTPLPAGAVPRGAEHASVRAALHTLAATGPVGTFPTVAVVLGLDHQVWATTGAGFVPLGGVVADDPAVAAAPDQLWFFAKGLDGRLWLRTADTGWQKPSNPPEIGTSLTAAYFGRYLYLGYTDAAGTAHMSVIDPTAPDGPDVVYDAGGPPADGVAVSAAAAPLIVGPRYTPGLLGPAGTLYTWNGLPVPTDGALGRVGLACAPGRPATVTDLVDPPYPTATGAVACRSTIADGVNFIGSGEPHYLGGHIIGGPGLALNPADTSDLVVYAVGLDRAIWMKTVTDTTEGFRSDPTWVRVGGFALGGVQATAWTPW